MMKNRKVFVHIVTYNSDGVLQYCLGALSRQKGYSLGENLSVIVRDNASVDQSVQVAQGFKNEWVIVKANRANMGFCAAHNQGVYDFLLSNSDFLLILNPDLRLADDAIEKMTAVFENDKQIGLVTPRLYRADDELRALEPLTLDAAGMVLNSSLRHLDRGSGELERGQFGYSEQVFGATGAAVLISRNCVQELLLSGGDLECEVDKVYPQLAEARGERALLFDEAFFAYREDADLCWRAKLHGFKCFYVADAVGYHKRVVTPERRAKLPAELNSYSVRNRFLLQINNFSWRDGVAAIIAGLLIRNLIVILGVLVVERSSIAAFHQLAVLWRRALRRRRVLFSRIRRIGNGAS